MVDDAVGSVGVDWKWPSAEGGEDCCQILFDVRCCRCPKCAAGGTGFGAAGEERIHSLVRVEQIVRPQRCIDKLV